MRRRKKVLSCFSAFLVAFSMVVALVGATNVKAEGHDIVTPEIREVKAELVNPDGNGEATTASAVKVSITAVDDVAIDQVDCSIWIKSEDGSMRRPANDSSWSAECTDNPGWEVTPLVAGEDEVTDVHVYTCTIPLTNCDYKGILYIDSVYVKDKGQNMASYDATSILNVKMNGANEITNIITEEKRFTVLSAKALNTKGEEYQQGAIVTPGTTVTYKVVVGDELESSVDELSLAIVPDLNNTDSEKLIPIRRVSGTNEFRGDFTFEGDMYPTAWRAYGVYGFGPVNYVGSIMDEPVIVYKNGNQLVMPTCTISVEASVYDFSEGRMNGSRESIVKNAEVPKYSLLTDVVSLPKAPVLVDGVASEWYVYTLVRDDVTGKLTKVIKPASEHRISKYEREELSIIALPKGYLPMSVMIPVNEDGNYYETKKVEWVKASTDEEVLAYAKKMYEKDVKKIFSDGKLVVDDKSYVFGVETNITYVTDEIVIVPQARYVYTDGRETWFKEIGLDVIRCTADKLPTADEIKKAIQKTPQINGTPSELTFQKWELYSEADTEIEYTFKDIQGKQGQKGGLYPVMIGHAKYDKDIIESGYHCPKGDNTNEWVHFEYIDFYPIGMTDEQIIAELKARTPGGYTNWEVDIYGEWNGSRYFHFYNDNGEKISEGANGAEIKFEAKEPVIEKKQNAAGATVIESSISFDLSGTKTVEGVTSLTTGAITRVVDLVNKTLDTAKNTTGTVETPRVKVSMANATVIPTEILEAAKGSDIDLEFEMTAEDGTKYSWIINGNSIVGSNLKNVNLKVNKNTNNVPASVLGESVAKNMPNIQISLADHGLFGFTAGLKYYVGKEYAGQYANLLYYTNGRLEIQNSCPVDAEGYTVLTFTHASDYVIAMGENLASVTNAPAVKSPKTSDSNAFVFYVAFILAGATAALAFRKRV